MSIFSGWTLEKLKIAYRAATSSPEGLAAVAIVGLVMIAALAFAGFMITHHLGGFYAKIQEEEELARLEEEEEEKLRRQQEEELPPSC